MNTVASQVTLFTDDSVDCAGPIRPGPSLHDWAGGTLGPDDYPTRAQYGRYLEWVFAEAVRGAPSEVRVEAHTARAVRLDDAPDGRQSLTLDDGRTLSGLSAVVLAQGHLPVARGPGASGTHRVRRAARPAPHPARQPGRRRPLSRRPGRTGPAARPRPQLLRPHGPADDGPRRPVRPRRPRSCATRPPAASRGCTRVRGAASRTRRAATTRRAPTAATSRASSPTRSIARFRKRADSGDAPDFLARDMAPGGEGGGDGLLRRPAGASAHGAGRQFGPRLPGPFPRRRRTAAPKRPPCSTSSGCRRPTAGPGTASPARTRDAPSPVPRDWREWLLDHLREDAAQAALGNVGRSAEGGPGRAARPAQRTAADRRPRRTRRATSRRDHLDRWYTPLNAFLSIGPPRRRDRGAGRADRGGRGGGGRAAARGPRAEDGAWVAHSPDVPGSAVRATTLVEARLPEPDLRADRRRTARPAAEDGRVPAAPRGRLRDRRAGRDARAPTA